MTSMTHPALLRKGWDITADGEFYLPTRALFGRGIASQIAGHVSGLGADAVLLVTDPASARPALSRRSMQRWPAPE
jgi:hypothetical protein